MNIVTENTEVIANMQKRIDELTAHCEVLTKHINKLDKHAYDHTEGGVLNCCVKKEFFESAVEVAEQTPQQSLANIKADAIDRAIDTSAKVQTYGEDNKCIRVLTLQEYAEEIRKESK